MKIDLDDLAQEAVDAAEARVPSLQQIESRVWQRRRRRTAIRTGLFVPAIIFAGAATFALVNDSDSRQVVAADDGDSVSSSSSTELDPLVEAPTVGDQDSLDASSDAARIEAEIRDETTVPVPTPFEQTLTFEPPNPRPGATIRVIDVSNTGLQNAFRLERWTGEGWQPVVAALKPGSADLEPRVIPLGSDVGIEDVFGPATFELRLPDVMQVGSYRICEYEFADSCGLLEIVE